MGPPPKADFLSLRGLSSVRPVREAFGARRLSPETVTAAYIVAGILALYLSDFLFPLLLDQPGLARVQALKGGVEVLLTGAVIFVLTDRARRQIERARQRLERRGAELDVLHRVLRHNLRNDMNVIEGNASLAAEKSDEGTVGSHCETIRNTASEALRYTEQANRIRRVDEAAPAEIDLAAWVPRFFERHPLVDDSVRVETDLEDGVTVSVNGLFGEAIDELVTNSVQHNCSETPRVRVRAHVDPGDPGWVVVEAADNGPGISAETWRIVQEGEESQLKHLEGLGLWFVYWTIQESGGEMERFESDLGGAGLRLRLPRA
jgi:signal transduction histidine kinase